MATQRSPRISVETLQDDTLKAIAQRGGIRHYPAQTVLVNEGDRSDTLFVILSGRVKAYGTHSSGRDMVFSTQGTGEFFGEMTLDGGSRSASVITVEPTSCAVVPGADLRDFLAQHPDFALHLVKHLIKRVRQSTEQVKSLALDDVYGRIARLLLQLAQDDAGVLVVREKLTQQDIAERVGSSREMVSRVFKPLVQGGYIEMRNGHIALLKKLPAGW